MIKYVIDRIEEDIAVCEQDDRTVIDIPLSKLYDGAKEGDHIKFINGIYYHDFVKEEESRKRNIELQNKLFEKK